MQTLIVVQTETENREYEIHTMDQLKKIVRLLDREANLISIRTEQ